MTAPLALEPPVEVAAEAVRGQPAADGSFARNSLSVAAWTTVSRVSGFVRIAVVAAVLGPTYTGNIFQATSSLPMMGYAALTGSLFSSLLVPFLVRHIDRGDRQGTIRVARSFLSTALAAFGVAAVVLLLAEPWVLRLLSAGVADPVAAAEQQRIGAVLLTLFLPQLLLYAIVGTAEAVMNAHGRFALANAAPAVENIGIIATMAATAVIFGTGHALADPPMSALLLLGLGTTGAVAAHASLQWYGAARVGVRLLPWGGWRHPEIKDILHRAVPSLGYSTMEVLLPFSGIIVANRVPGGVLAFQFAFLCCTLPQALAAKPVGVALLPQLSRLFHLGQAQRFRDELVRGAALVAFLAVPAAWALVALAEPIARALTFGEMSTPDGRHLVAVSLASVGLAVLGTAAMTLTTYAFYARADARTPFRGAILRTVIIAVGMVVGLNVPAGQQALITICLTISVAEAVGGAWMAARLRAAIPRRGEPLLRPLVRTAALAAVSVAAGYAVSVLLAPGVRGRLDAEIEMVAVAAVSVAVYLLLQWGARSPELALLRRGRLPGAGEEDEAPRPAVVGPAGIGPRHRRRSRVPGPLVLAGAGVVVVLAALVTGPVVTSVPPLMIVLGAVAVGLVALACVHPPAAAYLLLAATPLLAGFNRNAVLPLLRPHEALALLLGTGLLIRAAVQLARGQGLPIRWRPIDTALVLLAVTSSVLPLLWMIARGMPPTQEDILYAATLWKFAGVYLLVRASVRTNQQIARCLWICVGVGVVVAVLAVLQAAVPAVADALYALFPDADGAGPEYGRGAATIGSSIALGDVMAFDLAICLGWAFLARGHRRLALALAFVFVLGGIASGQFSGVLAVVVVVVAIALLTHRTVRLMIAVIPTTIVGGLLLWPVIAARLADIDLSTGLPQSWGVRLENLRLYIWPQLFDGLNWLFGVRPAGVVHVDTPYAPQVYIESGHTWLLWTGGIPFVLAYLYFTWVGSRQASWVYREERGPGAVAAIACLASLLVAFVLMTFDPHLTMRGAADLLFSLLALTTVAAGIARRREATLRAPWLLLRTRLRSHVIDDDVVAWVPTRDAAGPVTPAEGQRPYRPRHARPGREADGELEVMSVGSPGEGTG